MHAAARLPESIRCISKCDQKDTGIPPPTALLVALPDCRASPDTHTRRHSEMRWHHVTLTLLLLLLTKQRESVRTQPFHAACLWHFLQSSLPFFPFLSVNSS